MKLKLAYILSLTMLFFSGYLFLKRVPVEKNERSYFPDQELFHQHKIHRIPDDLTFAGEKIHFKTPEAYNKYYQELNINTVKNSSTRLLLRNVNVWLPSIERTLKVYQIPDDFKYIAVAESHLNTNVRSHKGAAGFWQFTAETAVEYGLEVNDEVDERYNWYRSTIAACKYFKQAYKRLGNWTSAAASYNRGIGGLELAFQKQSVNSYYDLQLNKETSKYIYKILALKDLISRPKKYELQHSKTQRMPVQLIKVDTTIHDIREFALNLNLNYEVLISYNPWILQNKLTIKKPNSVYYLTVPSHARIIHPQIADTNRVKTSKGLTWIKPKTVTSHS